MATVSSPTILLALGIAGLFALTGCQESAETLETAAVEVEPAEPAEPAVDQPEEVAAVDEGSADTFTIEDIAQHATLDDCWIVVDGVVYDVSGFGPSHPGGASRIEQICGTDATGAFRGQHGSQGAPNSTLAGFEIGILG